MVIKNGDKGMVNGDVRQESSSEWSPQLSVKSQYRAMEMQRPLSHLNLSSSQPVGENTEVLHRHNQLSFCNPSTFLDTFTKVN